ncbi:MAG: toxic anion resistance protein [Clostridia bacterium]|nr:toxic anion resistance protein [Clostridia bacterium]
MSEEIKLTFDAPTPELTLTPNAEVVEVPAQQPVEDAAFSEVNLTEAERRMVDEFSAQIDIKDTNLVLQYGAAAQQKIANFSDSALENVRNKDMGEVGGMIGELVAQLDDFNALEEPKGIFAIFKKAGDKLETLRTKYEKTEVSVNRIVEALEGHQVQLLKDIAVLDKLYDMNLTYFKELSMYIIAGKKKLEEERATTLPDMLEKAKQSGLPEDSQAANDFAAMCDRFEKKIHDLELTRMVSIQMAPQIRLVQNNDSLMVEKIQSTIVNTIPLWKSQMVIALGLAHSSQAMKAQRAVTDMTNELLKRNAEALKMGTIEVAKESERGIVDIETLKQTNETLISTLDEVVKIQEEGRTKRREAEAELGRIEEQLKQKLLTMSTPQN